MPEISASQFPGLYDMLHVVPKFDDMGCIMLDLEAIPVSGYVIGAEDDLYYSENEKYVQGPVAETKPHLTLLFGLLYPGKEIKSKVDMVLKGWEIPTTLEIDHVDFFASRGDEKYSTIIGHIKVTEQLLEGHDRLRMLPHVDTFPTYKPHMTLAYVKEEATTEWVESLSLLSGKGLTVSPTLNYGG